MIVRIRIEDIIDELECRSIRSESNIISIK